MAMNTPRQTSHIKREILVRLIKAFYSDNFGENARLIPYKMRPKDYDVTYRCCVYKERAILTERIKLAMGGDKNNPNVIEVIDIACDECPMSGYNVSDEQLINSVKTNIMPSLINSDLLTVDRQIGDFSLDVVLIGDGNTIVAQYPKAGETVYSGQKVFLKTDGDTIECPDFSGYSRKEIIEYWTCSGLSFVVDGYGIVYEQNVNAGTLIDQNTEIIVKLKDIEDLSLSEDEELDEDLNAEE